MNTDINQIKYGNKESWDVPIDLEFDQHLFEAYLNDRIENEILRMMEHQGEKSSKRITPLSSVTPNHLQV